MVSTTLALRQLQSVRRVLPAAAPPMRLACNVYSWPPETSHNASTRIHLAGSSTSDQSMVITHANGFHKELWEPVLTRLDQKYSPRNMYAIDCRNHGDSAILNKDVLEDTFEWISYARDVLSTVDSLRLKKPIGMGHRQLWSKRNVKLMAEILRPGTFSAILAVDPTMFPASPDIKGSLDDQPWPQMALKRRDHWKSRLDMDAQLPFTACENETCRIQEAAAFAAKDSAPYDAFERLGEISIPIHIITGEHSDINPPELVALKLERCKFGTVEVIKDAGHLVPMDAPQETANSISKFLKHHAQRLDAAKL
ncbi:hypothetical protein BGZ94_006805 [Podila epigama]|nr:hypothetical protein BGZ94_006805 [Podila epigama]